MKGSNSAKEHRRRCLLGLPRLFSPHALQGGMRSRLQWRLCCSCRVMSTPPECFSLSLSHWPALTSLNKKHVPAICLPSSCKWNLSRIWVVLKKNRRWRAVISQGKKRLISNHFLNTLSPDQARTVANLTAPSWDETGHLRPKWEPFCHPSRQLVWWP